MLLVLLGQEAAKLVLWKKLNDNAAYKN
jgi:hypothetical protein